MNKKSFFKNFLPLVLIFILLTTPVMADTSFTFTVPGPEGEEKSEAAQKIEMMMDIIKDEYYKDVKEEDLLEGAIKGMFETLDSHSTYFNPEDYSEFMSDIKGEIVGIGVQIERRDERITVVAPIEGTPAYKAGLKTGDKIISVDGVDISGYTPDKAAKLIRGEEGTTVKIGVKRDGVKDTINFEFVRELIVLNPVKYEIKEGNIGYIRISEFSESIYDNFANAVDEFSEKGVKGVVIDLRGNPGGLLDQVIEVCKLLIPKGPIVKIQVKNEIVETYESELDKAPFKLVVLTNGGSASASEIMAGAIKDSKTGILVGEKTYGKGTVQQTMRVQGGGGVKLTIANYLTPSGFSLDGIGITPDIEVKASAAGAAAEYAPIKGDRSIKSGIIGLDVLGVQQRLNAIGYDIKKQDGIFGEMTKTALLKFQKDNSLKLDASIDADDLKTLQSKFEEKLSKGDPQLDRAMAEMKKMLEAGQ
ncbi:MAG TPA: S41 family peptidase [Clostridia bacterium]|nr:S41 family peptidase [Clostridia bacterium]